MTKSAEQAFYDALAKVVGHRVLADLVPQLDKRYRRVSHTRPALISGEDRAFLNVLLRDHHARPDEDEHDVKAITAWLKKKTPAAAATAGRGPNPFTR